MNEEQLFYYKDTDSNSYLIAKHELDESEIGNYVQITENEYNAYLESKKQLIDSKEQSPINIKKTRISELKTLLKNSDYQAIKYAEGCISEQEYAPIKELRQRYRDEINQLEQEIENEQ